MSSLRLSARKHHLHNLFYTLPAPAAPAPAANASEPQPPTLKLSRSDQSRLNGALSHGPTSPEGKFKCSRSALKHGLSGTIHTALDIEDPAEFQAVIDAAIDEFHPESLFTRRLVEELAHLDWRRERLRILETAYLNQQINEIADVETDPLALATEGGNEIAALVHAWINSAAKSSTPLELLRRYLSTLNHQFNTTLAAIHKREDRLTRTRSSRFHGDYQLPQYPSPSSDRPQPRDRQGTVPVKPQATPAARGISQSLPETKRSQEITPHHATNDLENEEQAA